MNDFDVNLTGLVGIMKSKIFYKPNRPEKERMFKCDSGPGCEPTELKLRKIKGHWVTDKMPDTLSSSDFEAYIDSKGKKHLRPVDPDVEVEQVPEVQTKPKKEK